MNVYMQRWNDPVIFAKSWRILVCRYRPRALPKASETWDVWFSELAPSPQLHADAYGKNRKFPISHVEYCRRYLKEMNTKISRDLILCISKLVVEGNSITLLCSSACTNEDLCHRSLLKELIMQACLGLRKTRQIEEEK